MGRLSHLAPEEIAGAILLVVVLTLAAMRPSAITELFASPYATPAPGGGPARELVPEQRPAPSPATLTFQRELSRPQLTQLETVLKQRDPSRP